MGDNREISGGRIRDRCGNRESAKVIKLTEGDHKDVHSHLAG
jgi:hypothetical protein